MKTSMHCKWTYYKDTTPEPSGLSANYKSFPVTGGSDVRGEDRVGGRYSDEPKPQVKQDQASKITGDFRTSDSVRLHPEGNGPLLTRVGYPVFILKV